MKRPRLLRWSVSLGILFAGVSLGLDQTWGGALLLWLFAFGIFWLMKGSTGKGTL